MVRGLATSTMGEFNVYKKTGTTADHKQHGSIHAPCHSLLVP